MAEDGNEAVPGDDAFRRTSLLGTVLEPSYSGAQSFMRRKYTRDLAGVDIAVSGIPFDQAVTNRPGTRFGPEAIRRASAQHAWGAVWPWFFDPFDTLAVIDYGDCWFDWGKKEDVTHTIEAHAQTILAEGVEMLTFGGDHYISYPLLKAHAAKHGPLALIQFDAHRDVEPDPGGRIDHGTMFSYAIRDGIIDPSRSVQLGIRTTYHGEQTHGIKIIYADTVHEQDPQTVADMISAHVGPGPAYLSFDIDFLDPAFAPGTGTPVPGGLSTFQALSILRRLKNVNFVGADLVEVSPPFDTSEITANAAAMIALEYLCLRAYQRGARGQALEG
ncbi:agmatinase [Rhodoligotrophos appendicifer]|uniref:agmatinase n=1 Tax=Rhodoligotrophos appendicifer TaxID=987056 RepID=UPI001185FD7B|nr:agmatinase [Rhodoligotrophos appendicifer]